MFRSVFFVDPHGSGHHQFNRPLVFCDEFRIEFRAKLFSAFEVTHGESFAAFSTIFLSEVSPPPCGGRRYGHMSRSPTPASAHPAREDGRPPSRSRCVRLCERLCTTLCETLWINVEEIGFKACCGASTWPESRHRPDFISVRAAACPARQQIPAPPRLHTCTYEPPHRRTRW